LTASIPHSILAAHLGLGNDVLPEELGQMVDNAFFANHDGNLGRHAVIVPFRWTGSEVVQDQVLEGDDARVTITVTMDGRTITQTHALADVWRFAASGFEIDSIEAEMSSTAVFGVAETFHKGELWAITFWDQRGAPIVLLDPSTFRSLLSGGTDESRRGRDHAGELGADSAKAIAASAAVDYLAKQQESPSDSGLPPVWWSIARLGENWKAVSSCSSLLRMKQGPSQLE
jgi:hypothetical protein